MTDAEMGPEKKHIDEDWKTRAEEEKRKIEEAMRPPSEPDPSSYDQQGGAQASADSDAVEGGGKTSADPKFMSLISQLGAQAMAALGQLEDPHTGQRYVDLELARESIDILSMLEQKTRGNLDSEENATLDELLRSLRMAFVQISRAAQEQAMNAPPPGSPGGTGATG